MKGSRVLGRGYGCAGANSNHAGCASMMRGGARDGGGRASMLRRGAREGACGSSGVRVRVRVCERVRCMRAGAVLARGCVMSARGARDARRCAMSASKFILYLDNK